MDKGDAKMIAGPVTLDKRLIREHPTVVYMPSSLREGAHSQRETAKCRNDLES